MIGLLLLVALAWVTPVFALARRAVERTWVELLIIGFNDDENTRGSNLAEVLAYEPHIIFIQEGRAAHYRDLRDTAGHRLLGFDRWGVHQDTSTPARAGSVVIWQHAVVRHQGGGFAFGVKAPGLMARWIAWVRGIIIVIGLRVFLFSAHRPPLRDRRWWQPFDTALWARIRLALAARRTVIGQMDSNQHGGPPNLPPGLQWVAVGASIDGFVLPADAVVLELVELPVGSSDHHPIKLRVRVSVKHRRRAAA